MQTVVHGLVLRRVKLKESDQILTILTPELGVISAMAKGSLRLKSKLFGGCGLFCYSEFVLFQGTNLYTVNSADAEEVFFGLTDSVDKMALAMYLCEFCETLSPTGDEAKRQLRLLMNCLYVLAKGLKPSRMVKAVYELRALCEAGYMPDLLCCANCHKYEDNRFFFNTCKGSLLCPECAAEQGLRPNLDGAALTALRHICLVDDKKIFNFSIPESSLHWLGAVVEQYALQVLDKPMKTLEFLKSAL